nr:uncharacterized protein LOC111420601 [Onthophagus taurus]
MGQEPNIRKAINLRTDEGGDCFMINYKGVGKPIKWYKGKGYVGIQTKNYKLLSVYFSPNKPIENFEQLLDDLEGIIRHTSKPVVIGGDLNARTPMAGDCVLNNRGKLLEEWVTKNQMVIANNRNTPTFRGPRGTSIIDLTITMERNIKNIKNWKVAEDVEMLSDHHMISFDMRMGDVIKPIRETAGWNCSAHSLTILEKKFQVKTGGIENLNPQSLVETITGACNESLKKRASHTQRKPVYWWTREIEETRRVCVAKRRRLQRNKKRQSQNIIEQLSTDYTEARKKLRKQIKESKEAKWKELCHELEDNIWGTAYQVITKRFGARRREELDCETIEKQFEKLFPQITESEEDEQELGKDAAE